jgi:hypothetical protein
VLHVGFDNFFSIFTGIFVGAECVDSDLLCFGAGFAHVGTVVLVTFEI